MIYRKKKQQKKEAAQAELTVINLQYKLDNEKKKTKNMHEERQIWIQCMELQRKRHTFTTLNLMATFGYLGACFGFGMFWISGIDSGVGYLIQCIIHTFSMLFWYIIKFHPKRTNSMVNKIDCKYVRLNVAEKDVWMINKVRSPFFHLLAVPFVRINDFNNWNIKRDNLFIVRICSFILSTLLFVVAIDLWIKDSIAYISKDKWCKNKDKERMSEYMKQLEKFGEDVEDDYIVALTGGGSTTRMVETGAERVAREIVGDGNNENNKNNSNTMISIDDVEGKAD